MVSNSAAKLVKLIDICKENEKYFIFPVILQKIILYISHGLHGWCTCLLRLDCKGTTKNAHTQVKRDIL